MPSRQFFSACVLLCSFSPAFSQADWRLQVLSSPQAPIVLFGEQHDAQEHQELTRSNVQALIGQNRLSALALEMVEAGNNTRGTELNASEATVRHALKWNEAGWPWQRYGPIVMTAVRAGVPVFGANLPRAEMRGVMQDTSWDLKIPVPVLLATRENMVTSHCGHLPASQAPAMARIQIARNERMAQTVQSLVAKEQSVLLLAGSEHVKKDRGVTLFLSPSVASSVEVVWMQAGLSVVKDPSIADIVWRTPPVPVKDYCAELAVLKK